MRMYVSQNFFFYILGKLEMEKCPVAQAARMKKFRRQKNEIIAARMNAVHRDHENIFSQKDHFRKCESTRKKS